MRTIKQYSEKLSKNQIEKFLSIVVPYNEQKDAFLVEYASLKWLPLISSSSKQKAIRDRLVASGFTSPFGLQARQWKLALDDAFQTVLRYWEANIALLKSDYLYRHDGLSDDEKHYANWLLYKGKHERNFEHILAIYNDTDVTSDTINLDEKGRKKVRSYLHRTLRKITGNRPRVQIHRSIYCDPQTYKLKIDKKTNQQYVAITTTTPRKTLDIPLLGYLTQKGNARIVFDSVKKRIEVHQTREIKQKSLGDNVVACDYGTTEVATDDNGKQYGTEFGKLLKRYNIFLLQKGNKRNKLFAIAENTTNRKKKHRISKNNLKSSNRDRIHQRERLALENELNKAYRSLFISNRVKTAVFEDLASMSGKTEYKGLSRTVSLWIRSYSKERLEFFSELFNINVKYVNPAYTSQECNDCHYVHKENRNGDVFNCKHCGNKGHADHIAAKNIKQRMSDAEITLYTKHKDIKKILSTRHNQWKLKQAQPIVKTLQPV